MALGKSACCRTLLYLKRGLKSFNFSPNIVLQRNCILVVAVAGCKASIEVISLLGTEVVLCNIGYLAEFVIFSIQDLHVLKDHKTV